MPVYKVNYTIRCTEEQMVRAATQQEAEDNVKNMLLADVQERHGQLVEVTAVVGQIIINQSNEHDPGSPGRST